MAAVVAITVGCGRPAPVVPDGFAKEVRGEWGIVDADHRRRAVLRRALDGRSQLEDLALVPPPSDDERALFLMIRGAQQQRPSDVRLSGAQRELALREGGRLVIGETELAIHVDAERVEHHGWGTVAIEVDGDALTLVEAERPPFRFARTSR